jgi:hypothetical protein
MNEPRPCFEHSRGSHQSGQRRTVMALPSIPRLKGAFSYDPVTGLLTWNFSPRYSIASGDRAGSADEKGYMRVTIDQYSCLVHRVIWCLVYGMWPKNHIDHIDGCPSNNKLSNLRDVPRMVNNQNQRKPQRHGTSGFLGVSYDNNTRTINKWSAHICANGKQIYIGRFSTPELAHAAYVEAKRKFHSGGLL